jgi:hypothetical protein
MARKAAMEAQRNRVMITERHLLGFARSYLSEMFPNPGRQGCPSPDALRGFAEHSTRSEGSISTHLSFCSPCFNTYLACLERASLRMQRVRRVQRIKTTAIAAIVFSSLICFLLITKYRRPETASRTDISAAQSWSSLQMYGITTAVSVLIDLSNASPLRGVPDVERGAAPPLIPSNPSVNLILKLPFGSEDRNYSIRLNSHGSAVWLRTAKPHFDHGQALLHTHADFSQVSPGRYELVVVAKDFRVSVPVLVKTISPAIIRKP